MGVLREIKVEQPDAALAGSGKKKKKKRHHAEEEAAEVTPVTGLRVKLPRRQDSESQVPSQVPS